MEPAAQLPLPVAKRTAATDSGAVPVLPSRGSAGKLVGSSPLHDVCFLSHLGCYKIMFASMVAVG